MTHPTRAVARSTGGMVASPHALATAAGVQVLRDGGNAVDAAVATNAVLAVVYPQGNGVGGDAFWMVHEPKTGQVACYNGSGRAARGLEAAALRERGYREMPARGALSVTVPGAVRSWEEVVQAHGSRGLDELLKPALRYARDGYVVTGVVAQYLALNEPVLQACPDVRALFLRDGLPSAGDVLRNPGLGDALELIASRGADGFYGGAPGAAIVAKLNAGGNPMDQAELCAHRTERTLPWRLGWRGGEVLAHPPNSHGSCAQIALGAIAGFHSPDEAAWAHVAIEAFKHAFNLRDSRFGDPDFVALESDEFLSDAALERIRARIDPARVNATFHGPGYGDTIALTCADAEGRAVTLIQSLYMNFGSGLVAGESGIVLQNRGAYFNLLDGHPNELRGGKRPVHTLAPGMYLRDGAPEALYGAMGGDGQPQIHVQFLHNLYERGLDVQAAIDAPRWIAGRPHVPGYEDVMSDVVVAETRMSAETLEGLVRRGHKVARIDPFDSTTGHLQAIVVDRARGAFAGGADPRADSLALGP